jgi:hypothetical protein
VEAALAAGDAYGAQQAVERALGGLRSDASASDWASILGSVVRLAQHWNDDTLLTAATRANDDPGDANALWAVGHRLIDRNLLVMAESVLVRAVQVGPSSQTVAELAAVRELQGSYEAAAAAIVDNGFDNDDPLCSFLLAFNCAMQCDLEPARSRVLALEQLGEEPFATMAATLRALLRRADVVGDRLQPKDLRAWHFVWTGGILLAPSPPTPRSGLATWWDLRLALQALATSLGELGIEVDRALAPPDRGSQILGHAAAAILGVPLSTWRGNGESGLLVVYDELELDAVLRTAMRRRTADQVLYVHVADATREQPAAGDLTGLYGCGYRTPWLGGVDDEGDVIMPEQGSPEELATHLVEAAPPSSDPGPDEGEVPKLLSLVASTPDFADTLHHGGSRSRQWVLPEPFREV